MNHQTYMYLSISVMAIIILTTIPLQAASTYTCEIISISSDGNIRLTDTNDDPDFESNLFIMDGEINHMLAIVLMAVSMGEDIKVRVDGIQKRDRVLRVELIP